MNKITRDEKIDYDVLYKLRVVENKSVKETAEILNTTYGSINYYSHKFGIHNDSKKLCIDKNEFEQLYIKEHKALQEIATKFGCCYASIIDLANQYGLTRVRGKPNYKYQSQVVDLYVNQGHPMRFIAKALNIPYNRVRKILIDSNVTIRNQSQSHQNYNGVNPTFAVDWTAPADKLTKRCRRYFSNHIVPAVNKEKCALCNSTEQLHVHHLIPFSVIINEIKQENSTLSDDELFEVIIHDDRFLDLDNLLVVCQDCHYTVFHPYLGYKKGQSEAKAE